MKRFLIFVFILLTCSMFGQVKLRQLERDSIKFSVPTPKDQIIIAGDTSYSQRYIPGLAWLDSLGVSGVQDYYISNDTLYLTTTDSTYAVVVPAGTVIDSFTSTVDEIKLFFNGDSLKTPNYFFPNVLVTTDGIPPSTFEKNDIWMDFDATAEIIQATVWVRVLNEGVEGWGTIGEVGPSQLILNRDGDNIRLRQESPGELLHYTALFPDTTLLFNARPRGDSLVFDRFVWDTDAYVKDSVVVAAGSGTSIDSFTIANDTAYIYLADTTLKAEITHPVTFYSENINDRTAISSGLEVGDKYKLSKHNTYGEKTGVIKEISKDTSDVILLVIFGQSNADGRGSNSSAESWELDQNDSIQVWDEISQQFNPLDLSEGSQHGVELGLQESFFEYNNYDTLYIVKVGIGGEKIQPFLYGSNRYDTLYNSIKNSVEELISRGFKPSVYFFWAQGESNALDGNSAWMYGYYLDKLKNQLRGVVGTNAPFYSPKILTTVSGYAEINEAFQDNENADIMYEAFESQSLDALDIYHWNYTGLKKIADTLSLAISEKETIPTTLINSSYRYFEFAIADTFDMDINQPSITDYKGNHEFYNNSGDTILRNTGTSIVLFSPFSGGLPDQTYFHFDNTEDSIQRITFDLTVTDSINARLGFIMKATIDPGDNKLDGYWFWFEGNRTPQRLWIYKILNGGITSLMATYNTAIDNTTYKYRFTAERNILEIEKWNGSEFEYILGIEDSDYLTGGIGYTENVGASGTGIHYLDDIIIEKGSNFNTVPFTNKSIFPGLWCYFQDTIDFTPLINEDCELAFSIKQKKLFRYDRDSLEWLEISPQDTISGTDYSTVIDSIITVLNLHKANDQDTVIGNEYQDLTLASNILGLTNSATTFDLSVYLDDTDTDNQTLLAVPGTKELGIFGGNVISMEELNFQIARDFFDHVSHSGLTVNIDDTNNEIDLTVTGTTLTEEQVEDFALNSIEANSPLVYNDVSNRIDFRIDNITVPESFPEGDEIIATWDASSAQSEKITVDNLKIYIDTKLTEEEVQDFAFSSIDPFEPLIYDDADNEIDFRPDRVAISESLPEGDEVFVTWDISEARLEKVWLEDLIDYINTNLTEEEVEDFALNNIEANSPLVYNDGSNRIDFRIDNITVPESFPEGDEIIATWDASSAQSEKITVDNLKIYIDTKLTEEEVEDFALNNIDTNDPLSYNDASNKLQFNIDKITISESVPEGDEIIATYDVSEVRHEKVTLANLKTYIDTKLTEEEVEDYAFNSHGTNDALEYLDASNKLSFRPDNITIAEGIPEGDEVFGVYDPSEARLEKITWATLQTLSDGTGTDDQTLSIVSAAAGTISIESGNTIDLTTLVQNQVVQESTTVGTGFDLSGYQIVADFNEFTTDASPEGDEFIIMYDVSGVTHEKIDIDDLATYIGSGELTTVGTGLSLAGYQVNPDFDAFTQDNTFSGTDEVVYLSFTTHKRGTLAGLGAYMQANWGDGTGTDDQAIYYYLSGSTPALRLDGTSTGMEFDAGEGLVSSGFEEGTLDRILYQHDWTEFNVLSSGVTTSDYLLVLDGTDEARMQISYLATLIGGADGNGLWNSSNSNTTMASGMEPRVNNYLLFESATEAPLFYIDDAATDFMAFKGTTALPHPVFGSADVSVHGTFGSSNDIFSQDDIRAGGDVIAGGWGVFGGFVSVGDLTEGPATGLVGYGSGNHLTNEITIGDNLEFTGSRLNVLTDAEEFYGADPTPSASDVNITMSGTRVSSGAGAGAVSGGNIVVATGLYLVTVSFYAEQGQGIVAVNTFTGSTSGQWPSVYYDVGSSKVSCSQSALVDVTASGTLTYEVDAISGTNEISQFEIIFIKLSD